MRLRAFCDHLLGKLVLTSLTRVRSDFRSQLSWFCVDSHFDASLNRERDVNRPFFFLILPYI